MKTLKQLIKDLKLDYVNPDMTEINFPKPDKIEEISKIFHFDKYMILEEIISEMDKEGFRPANVYELLSWKDWSGEDLVIALGSVWQSRYGDRYVPYLLRNGSERKLHLYLHARRWNGHCRFAAVRKSKTLASELSDSKSSGLLDSLETRIEELEKFKEKVEKIINL